MIIPFFDDFFKFRTAIVAVPVLVSSYYDSTFFACIFKNHVIVVWCELLMAHTPFRCPVQNPYKMNIISNLLKYSLAYKLLYGILENNLNTSIIKGCQFSWSYLFFLSCRTILCQLPSFLKVWRIYVFLSFASP